MKMSTRRLSSQFEDTVRSQMGNLLDRVRQKSANDGTELKQFQSEYEERRQVNIRPSGSSHSYQASASGTDQTRTKRFEINYDNKNYIKSLVNEDRGNSRKDEKQFPKKKWEVELDHRGPILNFDPYPVGLAVDEENKSSTEWGTPYDNRNYGLSLLAGTGISNRKFNGTDFIRPEEVNERLGHVRNPYDYRSRDRRQPELRDYEYRTENFDDSACPFGENEEVRIKGPFSQKRRNTAIYRYGSVERNIFDYDRNSENGKRRRTSRSRSPSSVDYDQQNAINEKLGSHYNQYGVEANAHDFDGYRSILRSGGPRKRVVPRKLGGSFKNRPVGDQIVRPGKFSYHRSQRPRQMRDVRSQYLDSVNDSEAALEFRRSSTTSKAKRDVRSQYLDSINDSDAAYECGRNSTPRKAKRDVRSQYLDSVNDSEAAYECGRNWRDKTDYTNSSRQYAGMKDKHLGRDMYDGDIAQEYGQTWHDKLDRVNMMPDILDEHRHHPYDYGTTDDDLYRKHYVDSDGSEVWMKARERYSEIHHRGKP